MRKFGKGARNLLLALRDLALPYIPFLKLHKYDFAFLVHPRNIDDVYAVYPITKLFPIVIVNFFLLHFFWSVTIGKIYGLISQKNGKKVRGVIITIPFLASQIFKNKQKALKKVLSACRLAEKLGVKVIGLGALTSSVSQGGELLKGKVSASLTNGNSLTVGNSIISIKKIIKKQRIRRTDLSIAIVGATGLIGSAISELLLKHNFPNLILIGNTQEHIDTLKQRVSSYEAVKEGKVMFTNKLDEIKRAQFIIMAVAKEHLINDSHLLQKNVIIYDISQPKGIDLSILKDRSDVMLFEGGLVKTPHINMPLNIGFSSEVNFSCLAETMLLAAEEIKVDLIGKVTIDEIDEIIKLAKEYHFSPLF